VLDRIVTHRDKFSRSIRTFACRTQSNRKRRALKPMGKHLILKHVLAEAVKQDRSWTHVESVIEVDARTSLHLDAEQIESRRKSKTA